MKCQCCGQDIPEEGKITFDGYILSGFSNKDLEKWEQLHPDVGYEMLKMENWLRANPKRRKKNYRAFITKWLNRASEKLPKKEPLIPEWKKGV